MSIIPPGFNPERTIFVRDFVTLKWSRAHRVRYETLGYTFTAYGDALEVHVLDLSPGSSAKVGVRCPVCNIDRNVRYKDAYSVGHTLCKGCRTREYTFQDLTGKRFGKWRVVCFSGRGRQGISFWLVECDCGVQKRLRSQALLTGASKSCGCATYEYIANASRKRRGEKRPNMRRELNPNWNPRITDAERIKRRSTLKESLWRTSVYERDDYTCQVCQQVGGELNAHHLFGYTGYLKHRFEIENGITLCKTCHHEFHVWAGWGRKGKCTKQEFDEWLAHVRATRRREETV